MILSHLDLFTALMKNIIKGLCISWLLHIDLAVVLAEFKALGVCWSLGIKVSWSGDAPEPQDISFVSGRTWHGSIAHSHVPMSRDSLSVLIQSDQRGIRDRCLQRRPWSYANLFSAECWGQSVFLSWDADIQLVPVLRGLFNAKGKIHDDVACFRTTRAENRETSNWEKFHKKKNAGTEWCSKWRGWMIPMSWFSLVKHAEQPV